MAARKSNVSLIVMKVVFVDKFRKIIDAELDKVLRGDYDERGEILADFNNILDCILKYQLT